MPKAPSGPRSPRRPATGMDSLREGAGSHTTRRSVRPDARSAAAVSTPTARAKPKAADEKPAPASASQGWAALQERVVTEPPAHAWEAPSSRIEEARRDDAAVAPAATEEEPPPPSVSREPAMLQEGNVIEPPAQTGQAPSPETDEPSATARFHIFIVDTGWNSAAHRVLVENFALLRNLQKDDPIYVLSREQSIEFQRRHASRIGRDPTIAVHDLDAMGKGGTSGFHGFRLSLGLLRTPQQALQGLQAFTRFLVAHRRSTDLEADIRSELRREGFAGAVEIILGHEAREMGE